MNAAQGDKHISRKRNLKILRQVFMDANADIVFKGYLVCFMVIALLIWLAEPSIKTILDSIWYCFAVATTVGFGDLAAATLFGRILTIVLSIYSIAVVAVFTAIIATYFMDAAKNKASESAREFMYEMEHLPELSKEELQVLSEKVKRFAEK